MNIADLKGLISSKYKLNDIICVTATGGRLRLASLSFVPKTGELSNRECLRYWVPEGAGRNRSIVYDELLKVAEFHQEHGELPDNAVLGKMLCDSMGNGGKCLLVVRALFANTKTVSN